MAKLQNVTTVNMLDGEITAIKYNGAVYSKVDGIGKLGDILLRVKCGIPGQVSLGGYFEGQDSESDDDQSIYYRDEDGDVMGSSRDRFVVFRKAETTTASAPFAEMVVSRVEAVEHRMDAIEAKLTPESEPLKVGDYAVVTDERSDKFDEVVEVRKEDAWAFDFRCYSLCGRGSELFNAYDLRKATEAEVAAATTPPKPQTGDIVVITANTNGSRNKVGDIGKVVGEDRGLGSREVDVPERSYNGYGNYTEYPEMRLATPAEIEKYEASLVQIAKDAAFAEAGRKPNEYRKGDVVRVLDDGIYKRLIGEVVEVADAYGGLSGGNVVMTCGAIVLGDDVEIVCFAENRADLAKGAC